MRNSIMIILTGAMVGIVPVRASAASVSHEMHTPSEARDLMNKGTPARITLRIDNGVSIAYWREAVSLSAVNRQLGQIGLSDKAIGSLIRPDMMVFRSDDKNDQSDSARTLRIETTIFTDSKTHFAFKPGPHYVQESWVVVRTNNSGRALTVYNEPDQLESFWQAVSMVDQARRQGWDFSKRNDLLKSAHEQLNRLFNGYINPRP